MRDKFELYCKALGLALLCWGILHALSMIPMYFYQPNADMFLPSSFQNTDFGKKIMSDFNHTMPRVFTWISVQLLLQGIFPAVLGWYLMLSDNFFIRFCYPGKTNYEESQYSTDNRSQIDKKQNESHDDEKYAPPGYFK